VRSMKKPVYTGTTKTKQATLFSADGEQARILRWVISAKSVDETRLVLCDRFAVLKNEKFDGGKPWAVATDGRRLHAMRLAEFAGDVGTYRIIHCGTKGVEAVLDKDSLYPNAFHVIPAVAICDERGVYVPDVRGSNRDGGAMMKLYRQLVLKTSTAVVNADYLKAAVDGMSGRTLWISNEGDMNPALILDAKTIEGATMLAVIMPLRWQ